MSQVPSQSAVDIITKESSQTEIQQVESCSPLVLLDQASPSETSQPQEARKETEPVSAQVDGVAAVADHSPVVNDNKRPREQESTKNGELSTSEDKELPQESSSEVNQSVVEVATTSSEELEESPKKKQKLDDKQEL